MPTNEQIIEIVKFKQSGMEEVAARTKAMGDSLNAAGDRLKVLSGMMNDARYQRMEQQLGGINKQYELMSLRMRNVGASLSQMDGSAARFMKSVKDLNAQHDITGMKVRNAAMAAGLADGSEARRIRTTQRLNEEYEKMQRRAELVAQHGERWGHVMDRYGGAMRMAGNAAALGVGTTAAVGMGLARQGLSGTVEQVKLDHEQRMLGRQLAATLKPAMDLMTKGAKEIRERMERMDGGGQNLVGAGLVLGGSAAGLWALRGMGGMLGLGGAGATAASAGGAGAGGLAGTAGAAGAGAAGASRAAWLARAGGAGFQAYETARGVQDINNETNKLRGLGRTAFTTFEKMTGQDFIYRNLFGLKSGGPIGQTYDAIFGSNPTPRESVGDMLGGKRRDVQLSGGGFDAAPGAAFDRVTSAISGVEAEKTDATKALTEEIKKFNDNMANLRGRQSAPPVPLPREG